MFKKVVFGLMGLLLAGLGAFATMAMRPVVKQNTAPTCTTYVRHITGDSDSGIGTYWATDTYSSTYKVCQTTPGTYAVTRTDDGTFTTFGGASPSGSGTVAAGETGTFHGTWTGIVVTGSVTATSTDLGSVDFQCNTSGVCANQSSSLAQIFGPGYNADFPETWVWTYNLCDQSWVNSADGNSGNIEGSPSCPKPVHQISTCFKAWTQLYGPYDQQVVHPDVAWRIYNSAKCGFGDGGWADLHMTNVLHQVKHARQHRTGDGH